MFGEDALFGGIERTTVATCMEETLICRAHADDLFGLLAGNSALALNVAQMLSDRLGDASATIEDLAYAKISDRLVNLFERLAGRIGPPAADGTFLDVRLTHQDIASIIGSTRETVSLEMNRSCAPATSNKRAATSPCSRERNERYAPFHVLATLAAAAGRATGGRPCAGSAARRRRWRRSTPPRKAGSTAASRRPIPPARS